MHFENGLLEHMHVIWFKINLLQYCLIAKCSLTSFNQQHVHSSGVQYSVFLRLEVQRYGFSNICQLMSELVSSKQANNRELLNVSCC